MADRIPLIVNSNANQIQELPTQDKLLLSGNLEFDASAAGYGNITSTGGATSEFGIFNSTSVSNSSEIKIHCRNNTANGYINVADFKVGASNKIELDCKGEITAVQPTCLLTVPVNYTANNTDHGSTPHAGGTNFKPISFTNTTTNVNCTTSRATNATDTTAGITSISVPSAGTYLVSACISGENAGGASDDQVRFGLSKSGVQEFPSTLTYPTFVFGAASGAEFHANFTLPLTLSANDNLCVHLSHIGTSSATIHEGHFSVTKLH